jgi:myo-inositol-1(or 4)-monophosphatase
MRELKVAIAASQEAGKVLKSFYGKKFKVFHKGEIDLVTEVDQKAQEAIVKTIKRHFPTDSILAEEGDWAEIQSAKRRWIVDPLDGTTNFAHGYPKFCVSIAFEKNGRLECGAIFDPLLNELFYAKKNKGAFLNKKRIRVSRQLDLKKSLLVTGFPYDLYDPTTNNLPIFSKLLFEARAIRRDGSAALNLAYVACGRFDAFWEFGLKAWDSTAGILLVEEAGGVILPISPQKHAGYLMHIIAGPKALARKLKNRISKTKRVKSR